MWRAPTKGSNTFKTKHPALILAKWTSLCLATGHCQFQATARGRFYWHWGFYEVWIKLDLKHFLLFKKIIDFFLESLKKDISPTFTQIPRVIKFPIFFSLQTLVITALYKHCTAINFENSPAGLRPSDSAIRATPTQMGEPRVINLLETPLFFIRNNIKWQLTAFCSRLFYEL